MWKRVYIEAIVAHASNGLVWKDGNSISDYGWQKTVFWEIPIAALPTRGVRPGGFPTRRMFRHWTSYFPLNRLPMLLAIAISNINICKGFGQPLLLECHKRYLSVWMFLWWGFQTFDTQDNVFQLKPIEMSKHPTSKC